MKKHQISATLLIREVERFLATTDKRHFVPKPKDSENDVYVIKEKRKKVSQ